MVHADSVDAGSAVDKVLSGFTCRCWVRFNGEVKWSTHNMHHAVKSYYSQPNNMILLLLPEIHTIYMDFSHVLLQTAIFIFTRQ